MSNDPPYKYPTIDIGPKNTPKANKSRTNIAPTSFGITGGTWPVCVSITCWFETHVSTTALSHHIQSVATTLPIMT